MDFATTAELASLAQAAYDDGTPLSNRLPPGFQPYDIGYGLGYGNVGVSGEFFVAENPFTHQMVLSLRGTEPGNFLDYFSDVLLALGLVSSVAGSFQSVLDQAKAAAFVRGDKLYITGHSLGGAVAEYLYSTNHDIILVGGGSFDSPGISNSLNQTTFDPNFVHMYRLTDPIGSYYPAAHIATQLAVQDDNYPAGLSSHSIAADVSEVNAIAESALFNVGQNFTNGGDFGGFWRVHFLSNFSNNFVQTAGLTPYTLTMGGAGADVIDGSGARAALWIDGQAGNDSITGGRGDDHLSGGEGNNTLIGARGDDLLIDVDNFGGATVSLDGGPGNDRIIAFSYYQMHVTISGGTGDDWIFLGFGDGEVKAGSGNDLIEMNYGGPFSLELGPGTDVFKPGFLYGYSGIVTINDFKAGKNGDQIDLSEAVEELIGWSPGQNPFAYGYLRLVQEGKSTILESDFDGSGGDYEFQDYIIFLNSKTSDFVAYNFDGYSPAGSVFPV